MMREGVNADITFIKKVVIMKSDYNCSNCKDDKKNPRKIESEFFLRIISAAICDHCDSFSFARFYYQAEKYCFRL